MRRFGKIMAALLVAMAALAGLAGCQSQQAEVFLPDSQNDKLLAVLPEDWQFLEDWQALQEPPRLALAQAENCVEPMQFGHSWGYYTNAAQDEITSYIACGISPLDVQDKDGSLPSLAGGDKVRLVWQAEPSEVALVAYAYDEWQQRTCGNTEPAEILHTEITLAEDGSFDLLADEHSYVYVIDAKWQAEQPGLGGSCEWAFYAE